MQDSITSPSRLQLRFHVIAIYNHVSVTLPDRSASTRHFLALMTQASGTKKNNELVEFIPIE
jgi:hypothetical protein